MNKDIEGTSLIPAVPTVTTECPTWCREHTEPADNSGWVRHSQSIDTWTSPGQSGRQFAVIIEQITDLITGETGPATVNVDDSGPAASDAIEQHRVELVLPDDAARLARAARIAHQRINCPSPGGCPTWCVDHEVDADATGRYRSITHKRTIDSWDSRHWQAQVDRPAHYSVVLVQFGSQEANGPWEFGPASLEIDGGHNGDFVAMDEVALHDAARLAEAIRDAQQHIQPGALGPVHQG